MAITSAGYDGSVNEQQWAKLAAALGADYRFLSGCTVSVVAGVDRTVQVAAGELYGWGVLDTIDAAVNLPELAAVGSGVRWDTVVLRRNWQPAGGSSTFVVVTGSSTQTIASGLLSTPGIQDDQPIALIKVAAGQTAVQQVVSLAFGRQVPLYSTSADLPDASRFSDGQLLTQNLSGAYRQYVKSGAGAAAVWTSLSAPAWQNLVLAGSSAGWSALTGSIPRVRLVGDEVQVDGAVVSGSSVSTNRVGIVPASMIPAGARRYLGGHRTSGGPSAGHAYEVYVAGTTAASPDTPGGIYITPTYADGGLVPSVAYPLSGRFPLT